MRDVKKTVYSELVEFKYQFLLKNGELNTYIYLKNDRYDSVINKTQSKFYSFVESGRLEYYGKILDELTDLCDFFMIKNGHLHKQVISELEILKNQTSQYQLNEFIITYEDWLFFLYNFEGGYEEKCCLFFELKEFVHEFGKLNVGHDALIHFILKKIELSECALNTVLPNISILDNTILPILIDEYFAFIFITSLVLWFLRDLYCNK